MTRDEPMFEVPDDRLCRPRDVEHWGPWRGSQTTCDDCALSIGTHEARWEPLSAFYALERVDGTVGAYCTPHARERAGKRLL